MKKGFTMLELMITMSVMIILSGALLITWNRSEDIYGLQRAAYKMERDIREAQARTMEADEVNCGSMDSSASFGVFFNVASPKEYILFVDCDNNNSWNGDDVLVERVKMEKGVELQSLSPNLGGVFNVVFNPPQPLTYINDVDSGVEGEIILFLKNDPTKIKKVKVNTSGCIEVE
jgi:hypothetical protein